MTPSLSSRLLLFFGTLLSIPLLAGCGASEAGGDGPMLTDEQKLEISRKQRMGGYQGGSNNGGQAPAATAGDAAPKTPSGG